MARTQRFVSLSMATVATLVLGGCDPEDLLPTTADEAGSPSALVVVALEAEGADQMDIPGIEIQLEIVDVLLHEAGSDAWVVLNGETIELPLTAMSTPMELTGVPVVQGEYDAVRMVFGDGLIKVGSRWFRADIPETEIDLPIEELVVDDTTLSLTFDLRGALKGDHRDGFRLHPQVAADARRRHH